MVILGRSPGQARSFTSSVAAFIFLALIVSYIVLPMLAVLLYSLATRWSIAMLPDSYTLAHWLNGFSDERFRTVLLRSVGLATLVALAEIILVVPAVYWQHVKNPSIRPVLEVLAAIPFSIPLLVLAFGLLRASGDYAPAVQGTFGLLFAAHIAVAFSFVYWAIDGCMAAARVDALSESARTCGAGLAATIFRVILPNIGTGIAAGGILAFGISFNEVALVQIITGSRFETVQLYLLNMLKSTDADYNILAVMTIINFAVTLILSIGVVYLNGSAVTGGRGGRK